MPDADQKEEVSWRLIDIRFKDRINASMLFRALDPPADVRENMSILDMESGGPNTLERRLHAWGYTCDDNAGVFRRTGQPRLLGVYYDFTAVEDDERFMPIIAPFVVAGSRAIFTAAGLGRPWFEGWDFDGRIATRRRAEQHVEYEWA